MCTRARGPSGSPRFPFVLISRKFGILFVRRNESCHRLATPHLAINYTRTALSTLVSFAAIHENTRECNTIRGFQIETDTLGILPLGYKAFILSIDEVALRI